MNFADKEEFKARLGAGFEEEIRELIDSGLDKDAAHRMVIMFTIKRMREEHAYRAEIAHQISRIWAILTMMTIFLAGILIISAFEH